MKLYCLSRNNIYQTASSDFYVLKLLTACQPKRFMYGNGFDLPCMNMLIDISSLNHVHTSRIGQTDKFSSNKEILIPLAPLQNEIRKQDQRQKQVLDILISRTFSTPLVLVDFKSNILKLFSRTWRETSINDVDLCGKNVSFLNNYIQNIDCTRLSL